MKIIHLAWDEKIHVHSLLLHLVLVTVRAGILSYRYSRIYDPLTRSSVLIRRLKIVMVRDTVVLAGDDDCISPYLS